MNQVQHATCRGIEAIRGIVIAYSANGVTDYLLHVDICLRANLAGDDYRSSRDKGFTGAAHLLRRRLDAIWRDVARLFQGRLFGNNGVKDGI